MRPEMEMILDGVLSGRLLSREDAYHLIRSPEAHISALCRGAAALRDLGKGRRVSFSPKVFIPLTKLCRDFCSYCTFRESPQDARRLYMSPEEILAVARAGERLGCGEALFTLGERPEQRYPEARAWLAQRGYKTTLEYLRAMCALILSETKLLPHSNPGTLSERELVALKDVNASMGLMLENISEDLHAPGGPHELAPSKRPQARLRTLEKAGRLKIPFTTGLLIGIGETLKSRVNTLYAIRDLNHRFGHIQEVIIQNFRAKPGTAMATQVDPSSSDVKRTAAVARLILGADANIQVPPNLSAADYPIYLSAGINDWGGISPLTIDYVNPEAPWPQLSDLRQRSAEKGFTLRARLTVYPEFVTQKTDYLPEAIRPRLAAIADAEGYLRGEW
ncbi:MAG: 7,8-didemethyl-8-hydroxy-5-deazariboflavin synthase CofG [Acidobacteria bacterium]|nr:7,8-didemethyl-8-hydroxy-5-deazariboflavin synthase CofG [Acidobacteriota bacterium]MBI3658167.1 7,8-didemethyl-8-hydroxy-5-deazariboflavin synthase CofG [Acidobacteriota bacterium]